MLKNIFKLHFIMICCFMLCSCVVYDTYPTRTAYYSYGYYSYPKQKVYHYHKHRPYRHNMHYKHRVYRVPRGYHKHSHRK